MRRWGIPHSPAPRVWRLGNWVALPPYRISSCAVGEMLARRPQLLGEFLALALSIARIAQFPIALRLGLEDGDIGRIASLYDHDHPLLGKSNSLFQSPIALGIWEQRRYKSVPTAVQISTQGGTNQYPEGTNQYPRRYKSVPREVQISTQGGTNQYPWVLICTSGTYMETGQGNHVGRYVFIIFLKTLRSRLCASAHDRLSASALQRLSA